jgi:hypothetical protein
MGRSFALLIVRITLAGLKAAAMPSLGDFRSRATGLAGDSASPMAAPEKQLVKNSLLL